MKEYTNALEFWNNWFGKMTPQVFDQVVLGNAMLEKELTEISTNTKSVLDFGCGGGWASHFMAKVGNCPYIMAIDCAENSVKFALETAKISGIEDKITFCVKTDDYLFSAEEGSFDALFSSNVLDVVPLDVADRMISGFSRILHQNGKALIMLNPYLDKEYAEKLGMVEFLPNTFSKDGNLRCVNLSDNEWIEHFSAHFVVEKTEKFNFEGEPNQHARRLFVLTKK